MKFKPTTPRLQCSNPHRAGFTLAEILAALAFMAIVIPVAVQGLQLASRTGQIGVRERIAARLAERVMNELQIEGAFQDSFRSGRIAEGNQEYDWSMRSQPWEEDAMNVVTVEVRFLVQNQTHSMALSTLFDPNAESNLASP